MTTSSTNLAPALEALLGASRILSDPAARAVYTVDGITPPIVAKPATAEEVAEIVRFAALERLSLIPCGARTKLRIGMPPSRYDVALDMTALNQIVHYDPGDLTLGAGAGMPIAKLNATLFEHHQFLPLLVPWYSRSTIGGTLASGIDSPLCQFYGTARDFLIGAEFVSGSGAITRSGGRVVKNVTGYDLHKLLIGSLGTLAVIILPQLSHVSGPARRQPRLRCLFLQCRRRTCSSPSHRSVATHPSDSRYRQPRPCPDFCNANSCYPGNRGVPGRESRCGLKLTSAHRRLVSSV